MTKLTALAIGIHECLHMFQNSLCGNCHPPLQTDNSAKNTNFHQLQNQKYTTINTIGKQIIYAVAVSNRNNCSNDAMVTIAGAVTICDYHCKKNTHGHKIMEEKQQSTDAQCLPWMESC